MPLLVHRDPKYRKHVPSRQAIVSISGKVVYLGKYNSPESRKKYHEVIAEWEAANRQPTPAPAATITIVELVAQYLRFCDTQYATSGEAKTIQYALEPLLSFYENLPVAEFSPNKLRVVQSGMIRKGWARTYINKQISRVHQMFKWGQGREMVPKTLPTSLCDVEDLDAGKCDAKESAPVKPVPIELVNATLPHLSSVARAMVSVQLLTGCRPGEVVIMRPCDIIINIQSGAWIYEPYQHKGKSRGKPRKIPIGPKARAVLQPFMEGRTKEAFIFSAAESLSERNLARRAARQSPMTPHQTARRRKQNPANNAGGSVF